MQLRLILGVTHRKVTEVTLLVTFALSIFLLFVSFSIMIALIPKRGCMERCIHPAPKLHLLIDPLIDRRLAESEGKSGLPCKLFGPRAAI
jgi:hypothetical protein